MVWYEVKFHQSEAREGSLSHLIFPSSHFPVIFSMFDAARAAWRNFSVAGLMDHPVDAGNVRLPPSSMGSVVVTKTHLQKQSKMHFAEAAR